MLRTRLSVCLGSVLVYALVGDEWPNAVQELTAELSGEGDAAGVRMLCDVLSEAVEEVWEAQLPVTHDERVKAQRLLTSQLSFVMDLLLYTLQRAQEHRPMQKSALACLASWWKNVHVDAAPLVLRHPIVDAAFAAVQVAELEEVAGGCISELIRLLESFATPTSHHSGAEEGEDGVDEEGEPVSFSYSAPLTEAQVEAMQRITDRVAALLPAYSQHHSAGCCTAHITATTARSKRTPSALTLLRWLCGGCVPALAAVAAALCLCRVECEQRPLGSCEGAVSAV